MASKKKKCVYPARVTMLDAVTLDQEVFNILKFQLKSILGVIPPWIVTKYDSHLDLLLYCIIWKLSVSKFHGTFGQQLLNMKYRDFDISKKEEYALLIAQIISYLHSSKFFVFPSNEANEIVKKLDIVVSLCSLINLLCFFKEGKYPTLIDRLLGLRPVCIVNKSRSVEYNYMTRELLWHGFIELLTFTLSVINYQFIRRKFKKLLSSSIKVNVCRKLEFNSSTVCSICHNSPILPQHMGCSHIFCYYCIQTNRMVDSSFECPSCGHFQKDIDAVCL